MDPLKKIQVEGYAMFAEPELLFGNLDELCCVRCCLLLPCACGPLELGYFYRSRIVSARNSSPCCCTTLNHPAKRRPPIF